VKTDPTFWIVARASGLTAYILLTCSTVAGIVLKSRPFGTRVKPAVVTDIHRFLALLSLTAIAVHGTALLYDTSVKIDLLGLLVPGRISYRPLWTGAGIVAAELTILIYLSFSVRRVIRVRNWRRLHWLTYAVFCAVTAHGLLAGSDSGHVWARWLYLGSIGTVMLGIGWRSLTTPGTSRTARAPERPRKGSPEIEST
jgi:methionine sulfoxide reductase heme-binding subunit